MIAAFILAIGIGLNAALWQAVDNAERIKAGTMTLLRKRVWAGCRIAVAVAFALLQLRCDCVGYVDAALIVVVCLATFQASFPAILNPMCGWHRYYLGSTSTTDVQLIRLQFIIEQWHAPSAEAIREFHQFSYAEYSPYRDLVHRAGAKAFWASWAIVALAIVAGLVA